MMCSTYSTIWGKQSKNIQEAICGSVSLFLLLTKYVYLYKGLDMVLVLKKGAGKKEIEAIEHKLFKAGESGFNAQKYNGALKIKGDALDIQKKLRNEWERHMS